MSHFKLRQEKNCLNCGSFVQEIYCSKCGQENKEPYETVWGMLTHFVADILHWDGKFWSTIKKLILSPGKLSADYVAGKRASYVLPIRLYLICSLIFGLVVSFALKEQTENVNQGQVIAQTDSVEKNGIVIDINSDTSIPKEEQEKLLAQKRYTDSIAGLKLSFPIMDSTGDIKGNLGYGTKNGQTVINVPNGVTLQNIDSVIKLRKRIKGDSYDLSSRFEDYILRYMTAKQAKHKGPIDLVESVREEFSHSLPKSFFILMPFFAFILWLMYSKKYYFFYHHMVFTIHYYCVSFVIYAISVLIGLYTDFGDTALIIAFLGMSAYLFIAMKKFYNQSSLKTGVKFILHGVINSFALLIALLFIIVKGVLGA